MTQPVEPALATLGGRGPALSIRRRWLAMRPAFLTASVLPVVVGTTWGQAAGGRFDPWAAVLALLATALVHAGANVINDVGDELGGTDRINTERIFPYTGGSRVIQNGVMDLRQMHRLGWGLIGIAALLGVLLALIKGPAVLLLGLAGIALSVAYSLPPLKLASRGVGELTIAVGFGVLPVMGSSWLQTGVFDGAAAWISLPPAMWVTAILLINEVPDMRADALAGKRTLPVRLGVRGTRMVYLLLQLFALAAVVIMVTRDQLPAIAVLVPVLLAALAVAASRGIGSASGPEREKLRASIEKTLVIHALGCLWIAACAAFPS